MRVSRIFYEGLIEKNQLLALPIETSHYIMHVLRLKIGMPIILFNGQGVDYSAKLTLFEKKNVTVQIEESIKVENESKLNIHLIQAIPRGEKMDWIMQKAVELGVTKITPLLSEYCNIKLDPERMNKKIAHWNKIIISACEQSGRAIIPALTNVITFNELTHQPLPSTKIYGDPCSKQHLIEMNKSDAIALLIGPEGGLSDSELNHLNQLNFIAVKLGPRILRTETAAIASISMVQTLWGDF